MKRMTLLVAAIISSLGLYAQTTNIVWIKAKIKGLEANKWVYYREQGGNDRRDSVKSVPGGFTFKLNIAEGEGNEYFMSIGRNFEDRNSYIDFYLDKGTLYINGNGPLFKDAKRSGNKSIEDYNAYYAFIDNSQIKGAAALYEEEKDLYKKKDTIALKALVPKFKTINSARNRLSLKWVNEHPGSPVSAYVLFLFLAQHYMNFDELEGSLNKLSAAAKNNVPGKSIEYSIKANKLTGIGKTAMDFTQNDTSGNPVSLKDFRGKYVLLDFWASWCVPCRAENPNVVTAYNKYKDKNFTVISVSLDQPNGKEKWLKAIHDDKLTWTQVSDLKWWSNAVSKMYDIRSIPSNLLIGPDGTIIAKDLHGEDLDKKLTELLH
ncbi:MAG TPA: TlpA disulfide reductase family protein [Chitinophagaceae bacterium]|nr:TlpA disulfide reductase family protein [Chitinophagaceae bacterium]